MVTSDVLNMITTFETDISSFLGLLFDSGEEMRIASIPNRNVPLIENRLLKRDDALLSLVELHKQSTPNLYFAASAMDGKGYAKQNCTHTRAVFLDIDYGPHHRKPSRFPTLDEVLSYLRTLPIQPSITWHTGHGLQCCFRLTNPYQFTDGAAVQRYERVSSALARMAQSDSTFTPEHLFRVPLTLNQKEGSAVEGVWVERADFRQFAFETLQQLASRYDLDPDMLGTKEPEADDAPELTVAYADLPEELRDDIEMPHDERSSTMHSLISRMVARGYVDSVIVDAIGHGDDFRNKYGNRLAQEVTRSLQKIRAQPRVYRDSVPPLTITNDVKDVGLEECAALTDGFTAMLERYANEVGMTLSDRVRHSSRFHEHLFSTRQSGIIESPCGSGKSTWALCRIALHSSEDDPYWYVVETVDTLYGVAETLERLNPGLRVGRYHGFNAARCKALSREDHGWRDCTDTPVSVCHSCQARTLCCYYNRATLINSPAVVMTHSGFLRLLEEDHSRLAHANVIVDEELDHFLSESFTYEELLGIRNLMGPAAMCFNRLLPGTHISTLAASVGTTYASEHYVYRTEEETAMACAATKVLRTALRTNTQASEDAMVRLINFFRPSTAGGATYAFREVIENHKIHYVLKKNRYQIADTMPSRTLWILNASARLTTNQYPGNLPVYRCADLKPDGSLVSMHVIRANPTRTNEADNIGVGLWIMKLAIKRAHHRILLVTDTVIDDLEGLKGKLGAAAASPVAITHMTRGRIKGANTAGDCTLAFMPAMALFTNIHDYALSAALSLGRTFSRRYLFLEDGGPDMPGGRFRVPAVREAYALSALDEAYQTIMRTAVRNMKPVEVVVAFPDPQWLAALWMTVLPGFMLDTVYRLNADQKNVSMDQAMQTLGSILTVPDGQEISKKQVLGMMNYADSTRWQDRKQAIMRVLSPFYGEGSTNRCLRRKSS